ncbi:MAG: thiamine pyrophosphate-binding protein [Bryobacteraceae bacterium]
MMKLSDYVSQFLSKRGVRHVFMLTGGGCMHLVDSFGRNPDIECVCCLHEQGCGFAAEAYGDFHNGLGVALVTSGPGGTNAVTGVAAAWLESVSCLFLSGQAKRADLIGSRGLRSMGQQELDIVSVVKPITKYAHTVLEPESIRYELEKALHLATHGRRGPVWLDLPLDVQSAQVDETALPGYTPEPVPESNLRRRVAETIELLNRAERPVLFLGNGARGAANAGLVNRLFEVLQIPILVTWKALDMVPEEHPLYAGRPGAIGQRGANFTQQNSDCMLILGARLDLPQTAFNHRNFARAAKKIMVDVDPAEISKMDTNIDVTIAADAAEFVAELLRQAEGIVPVDRGEWIRRVQDWRKRYPVVLPEYRKQTGESVNSYALVDAISESLRSDDVIYPGSSGPASDIVMQVHRVKSGQRVLNAPGLGAMGTGLPGSIGACLASGRRRTICVNGDGGFQLNIQELETVRRLQLPIKFFVLCNGGYASIVAMQNNHFGGFHVGSDPASGVTLPDLVAVASAFGIPACKIEGHDQLRERVREVLESPGPVVCAVATDINQPTAPRATSFVRADGIIVSRPMEDLWPFLDRDEFRANMVIPPIENE